MWSHLTIAIARWARKSKICNPKMCLFSSVIMFYSALVGEQVVLMMTEFLFLCELIL